MAQRAIALALKLLDLGKVCQDLVLNLLRKFKVHDEGLSRPRTIIIGNSFRGAVEPKVLDLGQVCQDLELLLLIIVSAALRN